MNEEPLGESPVEAVPAPVADADSAPAPAVDSAPDEAGDFEYPQGIHPETKQRLEKRFGTLTARNKDWERKYSERESALKEHESKLKERDARIEFLMAQMGNGQPQAAPQPQRQGDLPRPSREQFGSDEDFYSALDRYADQLAEHRTASRAQEMTQQQQQEADWRNFQTAESKFIAEHPDYNQKVKDPQKVYFTPPVAAVLRQLENGPEIAYHLADNAEMGWKVASLSPQRMLFELGRIDAGIQAQKNAPKPKPPVSAAPPPPPKVEGTAEPVTKDISKMTDKEYDAWSNKQKALARNR